MHTTKKRLVFMLFGILLARALRVGNDGLTDRERKASAARYARTAGRPLSADDGDRIRAWRLHTQMC